jgi:predicted CoA-substrate-specific enzyme activase
MRIGIDIGSTTVKTVVLDDSGNIIHKEYERHMSKVRTRALEMLSRLEPLLKGKRVQAAVTGSAGLGVARAAGIDFVQEVFAAADAVNTYYPDADTAIELGGEDAKIIFFKGGLEERMNGSCAGGTGSFIDQMSTLMNISVLELDALAAKHEKIYSIASRCGVFAKTDIQPLLNQGARKEDIAASVLQAVVDQTVAGLAQGRKIEGKVVFLGGPLYFIKSLRERFVKTLRLDGECAVFPENGDCFVALGAAHFAGNLEPVTFDNLLKSLQNAVETTTFTNTLPPLFETREAYDAFAARHSAADIPRADLSTYSGDAFLGVDAGSTTTKLTLISENRELLYSHYSGNSGNPAAVVLGQLRKIYEQCGSRVKIRASAVTGYGEDLIKNAFSLDFGLVETVAHFSSARHFEPGVDFILDIGGQDIKCFKIMNGAIDSIMLNEACSSGCGSFIETFAAALGYSIADFAALGLFAKNPVDLGSRCTVFMNSSVKQAQKDGADIPDISAGLSVSVVKNAIYKVIRAAKASDLGRRIVVQGGTFLNDAVLRAFERELGEDVVRPKIAGLMGAFGAALYALERVRNREQELSALESAADKSDFHSSTLSAEQLESFTHTSKPVTCGRCQNRCSLTVNDFGGGRKFISGNRCELGLGAKTKTVLPNLYQFKYKTLRNLPQGEGRRGTVGIPMGLNMYENLPFWNAFFNGLGFSLALSPESNREIYIKGQYTIPSDTVCYPAKLLHGHIEALLNDGVKTIFYPCMPYNFDEGNSDNNYNCPVVAYYPELLAANIERLKEIRYLTPYFGLHRRKDFYRKAAEYFSAQLLVSKGEVKKAADKAYAAYAVYQAAIKKEGK